MVSLIDLLEKYIEHDGREASRILVINFVLRWREGGERACYQLGQRWAISLWGEDKVRRFTSSAVGTREANLLALSIDSVQWNSTSS